jgi:hypothetical protein
MLGQSAALCMPRWRRWLGEEDMTTAFVHYRQVVRLLLWQHPVGECGFLVLKAPQIGAFGAVFPEAQFVVTARDPFRALALMAFAAG